MTTTPPPAEGHDAVTPGGELTFDDLVEDLVVAHMHIMVLERHVAQLAAHIGIDLDPLPRPDEDGIYPAAREAQP